MSTGPLRRLVGTAGLIALVPIAAGLLFGSVTPVDAALRALATLAGVLVIGRLARWWLSSVARSFERDGTGEGTDGTPEPRRRQADPPAPKTNGRPPPAP